MSEFKCSIPCRASVVAMHPEFLVDIAVRVRDDGYLLTPLGEIFVIVKNVLLAKSRTLRCGYCGEPVMEVK